MTSINEHLPEGWVSVYDEEYKTNFYVNENTRESQWDMPTAPAPLVGKDEPPKYERYESKPTKKRTTSEASRAENRPQTYQQQIPTEIYSSSTRPNQQRYSSLVGNDRSSYSTGAGAVGGLLLATALAGAATSGSRYNRYGYDGYGHHHGGYGSGFGGFGQYGGYSGFGGGGLFGSSGYYRRPPCPPGFGGFGGGFGGYNGFGGHHHHGYHGW
ncbi:hypothetical protein WICPIJ_008859 [Wickerhamomyces pijperi]|uniref:WW domain-containing protein n=1 Tax=Wickerhamomyces pijperi TaxID=599730 RepID=A0A9P8PTU0_WICPI|nr:hypothetical protein WICPIJ_008859 [Wickerhamomyces pijperi]